MYIKKNSKLSNILVRIYEFSESKRLVTCRSAAFAQVEQLLPKEKYKTDNELRIEPIKAVLKLKIKGQK